MPTSVSWGRRQGRRGQPRLRRGASLHFSTNTRSRKWSSPAAGGNQLVSDVIPHSSSPVGWLQSHGLAVRINKHEGRNWLVGWGGRGGDCYRDWSKGSYICQEFLKHKLQIQTQLACSEFFITIKIRPGKTHSKPTYRLLVRIRGQIKWYFSFLVHSLTTNNKTNTTTDITNYNTQD